MIPARAAQYAVIAAVALTAFIATDTLGSRTARHGERSRAGLASVRQYPEPVPVPGNWLSAPELGARIERALAEAYAGCFRTVWFDGRMYRLRLPFGMNAERVDDSGREQLFYGDGKAQPRELWTAIERALAGQDALSWAASLRGPGSKTLAYDLTNQSWAVYSAQYVEGGEAGGTAYAMLGASDAASFALPEREEAVLPGASSTNVVIRKEGSALSVPDIYDYLYCVAGMGIDCTGFSYHMLSAALAVLGRDVEGIVAPALGVDLGKGAAFGGMGILDPARGFTRVIPDAVELVRPGDVILFRGWTGEFKHSAVVLSVDMGKGELRYLQCTDWAPRDERGVHDSLVLFDKPKARLGDPSTRWLQRLAPAFPGETEPVGWADAGERYRNIWSPNGGGVVVRLEALRLAVEALCPDFYLPAGGRPQGDSSRR